MASIFLLLQADSGFAQAIADQVATLPAAGPVVVTSGPYDVIAELSPGDEAGVLAQIRRMPGLSRVCVCRTSSKPVALAS